MYLEFRDLALTDQEREFLKIDRIRIYYNIRELFSGNIIKSLKEIRIIKSSFNFDYSKDYDLINRFLSSPGDGISEFILPDVTISGKNLKLNITNSSGTYAFSRLFFNMEHIQNETKVYSKGILNTNITHDDSLNVRTLFSVSGIFNDNFEFTKSLFVFKSIENKYFNSNKLSLQGSYQSGILDLQKIEDARPLDIHLSYSTIKKLVNVNFISEDFIPLDYFVPGDIDNSILQWLGTSVTGSAELEYSLQTNDLVYSAQLTANTNNSLIPEQAKINMSLKGDNIKVNFSELQIHTREFGASYKGLVYFKNFLPTGDLFLTYNNLSTKINANLLLTGKNNLLNIKGKQISINDTQVHNFITNINFFDNDLDFQTSLNIDDNSELALKQLKIDGNIQYNPDFFLNLSISTLNFPVNSVLNIVPHKYNQYFKALPKLKLNSDIFISTDLKQFSFSGSQIEILLNKEDKVSFSVSGNNESIEINKLISKINGTTLQGSIKSLINKRSVVNDINLVFEEIPYSMNISYYFNRGIFFNGNYGLLGSWYKSGNISEFSINMDEFPIPFKERISKISIETNGSYENYDKWNANLDNLEIKDIPGVILGNSVNIKGKLSNKIIELSDINYTDNLSSLNGSGLFDYSLLQNKGLNGNFIINSFDGEEYSGYLNLNGDTIDFQSKFTQAPLSRFTKIPVSGLINGDIVISGILPEPDITIMLQLEKGEFNSSPLEIETSFGMTENKINISYLRLKYKNQVLQKANGEFDILTGDFFIKSEYLGVFQKKNIQSLLEIKGKSEIQIKKLQLDEILKSDFTSNFLITNILVNNISKDPWDFNFEQTNKKISFNGGPKQGITGNIDPNGSFKIDIKAGLSVRGMAEGQIADGLIDMDIKRMEVDLNLLNLIPYGSFLEFTNGTGYGYLKISGQLNDPLFNGYLNVEGAEGNVFMVPEKINPFNTKIVFSDRSVYVGPEILKINNTNTKVGLELLISNWINVNYYLDINTLNDDKIHIIYDIPEIGLGLDGFVSGNFNISKDENGTKIIGDLLADDSIINLGSSGDKTKSSRNPLLIDMKFTTGKKVQFIWPSNTIPILRATAESGETIKLDMDMLNGSFSVNGDVNIKYGGIYYFQKSFYLSEGLIVFDENESRFDPFLGFKAQIKEVDSEGEVVNISLIQDNMPVSQFSPRFESDPPLSDVEIFSILGAGVFTKIGNEQIDLTSALLLTGDLVTQFAIIRNFETKVRDIFNLDLFSIRTQMIQNILIDRFIEDNTAEQQLYTDSFGRYLDNTTLYLGKYIGDDIFIQALLQINNQSFLDSDLYATNKLLVESTISLEWQTPLFLLGLSVKPDFVDPLSSIQNTSLDLSWGFSY